MCVCMFVYMYVHTRKTRKHLRQSVVCVFNKNHQQHIIISLDVKPSVSGSNLLLVFVVFAVIVF